MYVAIIKALRYMSSPVSNSNKDTKKKSSNLLLSIASFQFICSLVVSTHCLNFTLPVTRLLQSRSIDILDGLHLITSLKTIFISTRNNIDNFHNECYDEAVSLANEVEVKIT